MVLVEEVCRVEKNPGSVWLVRIISGREWVRGGGFEFSCLVQWDGEDNFNSPTTINQRLDVVTFC